MKWLTLKIYMLPVIMQEVDAVIEIYINLINELRRTNDEDTQKEFDDLRESIRKRIQELEYFYENNIHDLRITNFEKVRLRLKKLLMYDMDTLNKIENTGEFAKNITTGYNNKTSNNVESINTEVNKNVMSNTGNISNTNNLNANSNITNINNLNLNNLNNNLQPVKNQKTNASNQPQNKPKNMNVREPTVYVLDYNFSKNSKFSSNTKVRAASPQAKKSLYQNLELFDTSRVENKDVKETNKWREIVFKIKLTEKEYELLLKEKSKGLSL